MLFILISVNSLTLPRFSLCSPPIRSSTKSFVKNTTYATTFLPLIHSLPAAGYLFTKSQLNTFYQKYSSLSHFAISASLPAADILLLSAAPQRQSRLCFRHKPALPLQNAAFCPFPRSRLFIFCCSYKSHLFPSTIRRRPVCAIPRTAS